MDSILILAQAGTSEQPSGVSSQSTDIEETQTKTVADSNTAGVPVRRKPPLMQFLPLILIFVLVYFMFFRGPRKKQQQHKQMVQSLHKNDKVRTIGGVIGTVIDVKDDEITLKVDESNNTKIKIVPSAIGKNLSQE